ncbi:MAG: major capsid protein E [Geobacteraceae bacterium GWC2_58_44]|nr:MAG: major capsid protein E [Geobacteraceae bacterium GWC2_58_44]HBG07672.1 major capsid protein E [Geobacter sp.]
MSVFDVFAGDAFSLISLTDAINKAPFVPGLLGSLNLFQEQGVSTTSVMIEEKSGILYLVENKPRGASGQQNQVEKRKARSLILAHLPAEDRLLADEIQGVREFGSNDQAKAIENTVNSRLVTMSSSLDATLEHLRIGAIKGQILDSDGSTVIYNLFTEFGVQQEAEVDFDLDNANPASGIIRKKCAGVIRTMAGNLGASPFTGVHCLCGDAFFDDLIAHPETRQTFLNQQEAAELRTGYVSSGLSYGRFVYGGIVFENYRGKVGAIDYVNADKAHFFPTGATGLFKTYFGPANYMETVNTIGLPKYAKISPDMRFQKFVDIEAQSNPLPICTRPKVLMLGKRT